MPRQITHTLLGSEDRHVSQVVCKAKFANGQEVQGHLTIRTDKGVSVKTLSEVFAVELAGADQWSCPPFRTLLDLNRSSTFGDPAMALTSDKFCRSLGS